VVAHSAELTTVLPNRHYGEHDKVTD